MKCDVIYDGNYFYAPTMTMARALGVTPVRPSVHTYVRMYVCPTTSAL